jgi:hypothetical protein
MYILNSNKWKKTYVNKCQERNKTFLTVTIIFNIIYRIIDYIS